MAPSSHLLHSPIPGVHAIDGGHAIRAGATLPGIRNKNPDQTLWVGPYTTVEGGIDHAGSVILSRGSVTWQGIRGGLQVIIGAGCIVDGPIHCEGNVIVQAGARVKGTIHAGNDVQLLGACHVHDVECGGDVFIAGSPKTGALSPRGRIQTKAW